jgi:hypothetical protein
MRRLIRTYASVSAQNAERQERCECLRKYGALRGLEGMSTFPERGGLGRTEEKEGEEREEKADDDTIEHRPCARVAIGRPAAGATTVSEGIYPLFL